MEIFSLLFFLVGLVGIALVLYIFAIINLFGKTGRWIVMALLIAATLAVGNRWTSSPNPEQSDPWWFFQNPFSNPFAPENQLQSGWQNIPPLMLDLWLLEFGNLDNLPQPAPSPTPLPLPAPTPLPTPVPIPPPLPTPIPPPPASPVPTPTPVPSPSLTPVVPTPAPVVPTPAPTFPPAQPPPPSPFPETYPSPEVSPVPAWW